MSQANYGSLPFAEQIAFFRRKLKLPTTSWADIWQHEHDWAFVVAGAARDALLEDLRRGVEAAIVDGISLEKFKTEYFDQAVARHGWDYHGGRDWRARVIYQTNLATSHAAGRWQQLQAAPYWRYEHADWVEHPRPEHEALDGLVLSRDDPFWRTHFPPNGWGCRCTVRGLWPEDLAELGKSGPDPAPPIEWEQRTVGKNSASGPRTVTTPRGIDPGFAYAPGRSRWASLTPPPFHGWEAVLQEREADWPINGTNPMPRLPAPSLVKASALLPKDTPPEDAVRGFLGKFGATMQDGAVFIDKTGSALAVSRALFEDGSGQLKWLSKPRKNARIEYLNLLAQTLQEPDEIWWHWEQSYKDKGLWRLKRRYLRVFEIEGVKQYAISSFEWSRDGWMGSTTFMATQPTEQDNERYFNKQRIGRLVWSKSSKNETPQ